MASRKRLRARAERERRRRIVAQEELRAAPRLDGHEVFTVAAALTDRALFGPDDSHTVTVRERRMERGGIVACDIHFAADEARRHNAARVVYAVNQLLAAAIKAGAVLVHIQDEEIDLYNGVRLHGHTWKVPPR